MLNKSILTRFYKRSIRGAVQHSAQQRQAAALQKVSRLAQLLVGNAAALYHKQGTVTYLGKAESVTAFAQGWSIYQKISKLWCTAFHHAGKTGVFQQQGRAAGGAGGRNQAGAADLGVVENFLQRNAAGKIVCQTRHFVFTGQPALAADAGMAQVTVNQQAALAKPGKQAGGYCTEISKYKTPFIFANFNGTQGDVEVVTHEAGHAFEAWTARDIVPTSYHWPSMEACEVHSMSMEFFAWPWSEDFFGADARKFRYSHLASALTFIPYGTLVDHFQHVVYEKPDMTPAERTEVWKELTAVYMPWIKLDGAIPFFGDGRRWQRQLHIYDSPFYYIDYCLAQTMSLYFWAQIQSDRDAAWKQYYAYTRLAGTKTFTGLLEAAGLPSPFDSETLRGVCEKASDWLDRYDMSGIE